MRWEKRGLIFSPNGNFDWMDNSVLTPTPFLINEETVRVFGCFRDKDGVGRIGYIDLSAKNPSEIIEISEKPVIELGQDGCYDDNGMVLGDVIRVKDKVYMYYVAFHLPKKVKHVSYSGLAISDDGGYTFKKLKQTPVLERSEEGLWGRCIHSVIYDETKDIFRVWYSVVYGWEVINNIPYPAYDIKYIESKDGIHFPDEGIQCIKCNENEYRIGRPRVRIHSNGKYEMRYTSDTYKKEYKAGYAESDDGINWTRKDELGWLTTSEKGWDSEMACYPVILDTKYGTYMFYDGNGMGHDGFGYAELVEDD